MESWWYCAEHFNYSTNFHWYPKHIRLTFVCKTSWKSTPLLLSRVAKIFPVTKSVAVLRAVAFYVQAKKAWVWKKKSQQGWHSILQKLLVLFFSSSEIIEKKTTWHFPKISPLFELTSFLSRKINRKILQTAQLNCFKICQKGSLIALSSIQQTYSTKISTKIRIFWNHSKTHRALRRHFFDLVASKRDFFLLYKNWHMKVKDTDMVARSHKQEHP